MTTTTTYLITGATRGIGRSLVDLLSARADVRIIAGVRDVQHANAKALASKPNVSIVEIDSLRDDTAAEAAKKIEADGVQAIDVVIANAGIAGTSGRATDISPEGFRTLLNVNLIAPLLLFAAFKPLLQRANNPRLLVVSSSVGSFDKLDDIFQMFEQRDGKANPQMAAYSTSKTAVNFMTKRIALEEPWLTAVPLHPGLVATDMPRAAMGDEALQGMVKSGFVLTPEQSAAGIVKLAESATHDTHSGRFFDVQAGEIIAF